MFTLWGDLRHQTRPQLEIPNFDSTIFQTLARILKSMFSANIHILSKTQTEGNLSPLDDGSNRERNISGLLISRPPLASIDYRA